MRKFQFVFATLVICTLGVQPAMAQRGRGGRGAPQDTSMSFFVTSSNPGGNGGNLGGLAGADAHCQALAQVTGSTKTWRAYLSTSEPLVHARERIGDGPWFNVSAQQVAANVDDLHYSNQSFNKETGLTETGGIVNGVGDQPNQHDILTGSNPDGTSSGADCNNWTGGEGNATVGHLDRMGRGAMAASWNASHTSQGCTLEQLQASGGNGYFYCFAID